MGVSSLCACLLQAEEAQLRKKWHAQLQSYGQLTAVLPAITHAFEWEWEWEWQDGPGSIWFGSVQGMVRAVQVFGSDL